MRTSACTSLRMGRLTDEMARLQTGPGKFGRPALSGGLRKRSHGGNENPTRNRKSGLDNPPPTAGASELYPNHNPVEAALGDLQGRSWCNRFHEKAGRSQ